MGTIQESILNSLQEDYDLKLDKRKAYSDLVLELKKGVVDCMVVEKAVAEELAADNDGLKFYKLEAGAELSGNAMIFQKENSLKDEFNKAIQQMKDDGTMDKLVEKYFGQLNLTRTFKRLGLFLLSVVNSMRFTQDTMR